MKIVDPPSGFSGADVIVENNDCKKRKPEWGIERGFEGLQNVWAKAAWVVLALKNLFPACIILKTSLSYSMECTAPSGPRIQLNINES